MSVAFEVREIIEEIYQAVVDFNHKNPRYQAKITPLDVDNLLYDYIDDTLSAPLKWCPTSQNFTKRLSALVPWYTDRQHAEISDIFYEMVVDKITDRLSTINHVIAPGPWEIPMLMRLGTDTILVREGNKSKRIPNIGRTIIIASGGDYRVVDWERRIGSGEWKI